MLRANAWKQLEGKTDEKKPVARFSVGGREAAWKTRLEAEVSGLVTCWEKVRRQIHLRLREVTRRTRGGSRKTDGPDQARSESRTWC